MSPRGFLDGTCIACRQFKIYDVAIYVAEIAGDEPLNTTSPAPSSAGAGQ
jgi:hypothetical protein